jgi:glutathione S-transferase
MTAGVPITLYGAAYSVYVRAVRLALAEKGIPYRLVEVDIFAPGGPPIEHLARHPFGRIPAFDHGGVLLYESSAIERYVDEAFDGPRLQPANPIERARMNQAIGVLDAYAYRTLVWDIFVERVRAPLQGRAPDEALIASSLPKAETCLTALEALMGGRPFLAGDRLSLSDLHAVPMFVYFRMAREGAQLLARHKPLDAWLSVMVQRPSVMATRSPLEVAQAPAVRGGAALRNHDT